MQLVFYLVVLSAIAIGMQYAQTRVQQGVRKADFNNGDNSWVRTASNAESYARKIDQLARQNERNPYS